MKHSGLVYLFLTFLVFNVLFVLQVFFDLLPEISQVSQWVLVLGNFVLLIIGLSGIKRKRPEHHSPHEMTVFQVLFGLMLLTTIVVLLLMLIIRPLTFLIFMPFEFFLLSFFIGYYFFLTRHILPKRPKIQ